jgi:flavin reductase (DIM6/NTAB) family NADH-FMN oxidoreductase RutF
MQKSVEYREAIRRRFPTPVTIAIARSKDGVDNPITLGWWMNTSHNPPMFAISVGVRRYSLEVIRDAGEFVLVFPTEQMAEDSLYFGSVSGRKEDKIGVRGSLTRPAQVVKTVLLEDAAANFECVVEGELTTGDHVIFTARVVASHTHTEARAPRLYTLDRNPNFVLGGVRPL